MEKFQPTPQTPEIRKIPPRPETPGKLPPMPDKLPNNYEPEIDEEGDPTTRKGPHVPTPEQGIYVPDIGDKSRKDIEKDIEKEKGKKKRDKTKQGPGKPTGPTLH